MRAKLWRTALIAILCLALSTSSRAESLTTARNQIIAGIVVVSAGIAVVVTVVILHQKHKGSTITGCVRSSPNGMSLTDEKDKRIYTLSGDPPGLTVGNRMSLVGKRKTANNALVFEAKSITKDFGACTA